MSIKGIDNQMMVTRTAEYSKDAGAHLRKGELVQDYLAAQAKAQAEIDHEKVSQTIKAQEALIHKDRKGQGEKGREAAGKRPPPKKEAPDGDDTPPVCTGNHRIDIKI